VTLVLKKQSRVPTRQDRPLCQLPGLRFDCGSCSHRCYLENEARAYRHGTTLWGIYPPSKRGNSV